MQTDPTAQEPPGEGGNQNPQGSAAEPATISTQAPAEQAPPEPERPGTPVSLGALLTLGGSSAVIGGSAIAAAFGARGLAVAAGTAGVGAVARGVQRRRTRKRFGGAVYPRRGDAGRLAGSTRRPGAQIGGRGAGRGGAAGASMRRVAGGGTTGSAPRAGASRTSGRASTGSPGARGRTTTPGAGSSGARRSMGARAASIVPAMRARRAGGRAAGGFGAASRTRTGTTGGTARGRAAGKRLTGKGAVRRRTAGKGEAVSPITGRPVSTSRAARHARRRATPARRVMRAAVRGAAWLWTTGYLGPILTGGWGRTKPAAEPGKAATKATDKPPVDQQTTKPEAKPKPTPAAPTKPAPAAPRPGEQPTPTATAKPISASSKSTGAAAMTSMHVEQVEEAAHQLGQFDPANLLEAEAFCRELPRVFAAAEAALRTVTDTLAEGSPVHPSVVEFMAEIAQGTGRVRDYAEGLHPLLRSANADDFRRIEAPRKGEEKADVTHNAL